MNIQVVYFFFKEFSRTTFNFQGPPTGNVMSQIVQKCIFPVHSNMTLRFELFAPPISLHFSVHSSQIVDNYCIKQKTLCVNHL